MNQTINAIPTYSSYASPHTHAPASHSCSTRVYESEVGETLTHRYCLLIANGVWDAAAVWLGRR